MPLTTRDTLKMSICLGGVSPSNELNGLTTCFGIYVPETAENLSIGIIIDNGTGIHRVNRFMDEKKPGRTIQLQTHLHLDHLAGLRFNHRLFSLGGITHCLIPPNWINTMLSLVGQPLHPVNMKFECKSELEKDFKDHALIKHCYGIKIEVCDLPHPPEGSFGFKITTNGKVLVVATDCELRDPLEQEKFALFTADADTMLLDMQYSDNSYIPGHGHNCPRLVIETLSKRSSIGGKPLELIIVHRDPDFQRWDNDRNLIKEHAEICAIKNIVQGLDGHEPNFY